MFNNPQFARSVIMDHYENPRNKRASLDYKSVRMDSDSCIDDITVYLKVEDNIIKDVSFEGTGCTISIASTSMMSELLMHKTVDEARLLSLEYLKMVKLEEYNADILKESVVFKNVGRQANRVGCATLGWRGVNLILNESELNDE
ncbi:MAG: SUF system NifU family Fe-S cluster assembly protein [Erysipelothrix sp.]|nr:SUF system NifU family Fe-S cluster assembly protein [Erysipelothrix sp.]